MSEWGLQEQQQPQKNKTNQTIQTPQSTNKKKKGPRTLKEHPKNKKKASSFIQSTSKPSIYSEDVVPIISNHSKEAQKQWV